MNKAELVDFIAQRANLTRTEAARSLEAVIEAVTTTLQRDDEVSLVGFGTFAASQRAGRTGRNPRTGSAIDIPSAKVPKFRPGKALRDALN